MTGLLSVVNFLVSSITGEVWLVLFVDNMANATSLFICLSIISLSVSEMWNGLTKNGLLSMTSMFISGLGHLPISSHKLTAYLCLCTMLISSFFPVGLRADFERSIVESKISSSDLCLRGSSGSNHGKGSLTPVVDSSIAICL